MSERDKQRRPATFRLDGANVVVVNPDDATRPARGTVQITPQAEPVLLPLPVEPERRRSPLFVPLAHCNRSPIRNCSARSRRM